MNRSVPIKSLDKMVTFIQHDVERRPVELQIEHVHFDELELIVQMLLVLALHLLDDQVAQVDVDHMAAASPMQIEAERRIAATDVQNPVPILDQLHEQRRQALEIAVPFERLVSLVEEAGPVGLGRELAGVLW